ncbi:hypothetical protein ACTFIN_01775 [Clostridium cagae]|uniref:hypothetical protein n=1 Tax=Clostridium cagae TaxID=2080751 RepID=UPI003F76928B
MNLKTNKAYKKAVNRIKKANEEDKRMAMQLINLMATQNMTSCNAEIVLGLCHDLIEINSQLVPIK